ncbi:TPM domain-containing protein [Cupriavidus lacunae]|uniref:TPM domain-containing protein n=1 Tax=Cupriavidus lacunae TaxID=2666307 RepID=A0A370NLW8_9BURK|nr:TPM domain-containing protein [Cupriavidus lacunae]RDK06617.1 TPM domain-containing protein [Cupriavidus lacunae]
MPNLRRALQHIATTAGAARKRFPAEAQQQLHEAVHAGEAHHRGEIRVVIEASLPVGHAWAGVTPRERARFLFGALEVWNTMDHTGVLLYINLADHAVELLADRGINASVGPAIWRELCDELAQGLKQDLSVRPVLATVARINALLTTHFPSDGRPNPNELDDRPVFL